MSPLPPWTIGPFELLLHAEGHLLRGKDFDRRIALISFDDAIETTITTYLTLHPIQRNNKSYPNESKEAWLKNYHTRLDFLGEELRSRSMDWEVDRAHIVWAHDNRNEQYHGGKKGTPEIEVLNIVRSASLWVFGVLFEVEDAETILRNQIEASGPPSPPQRVKDYDVAIDTKFGTIVIAEQMYYVSEALFSTDLVAYNDLGKKLCGNPGSDSARIPE